MHLQLFSLRHCRSIRSLSNNLTGTIPPQLGNLSQLTTLYAQNRIALYWQCDITDVTLYSASREFSTNLLPLVYLGSLSSWGRFRRVTIYNLWFDKICLLYIISDLTLLSAYYNIWCGIIFNVRALFSLHHCLSSRSISSTQLTGTIPPQLGNLTQLISLYAQNRIVIHWHRVSLFWYYLIISDFAPLLSSVNIDASSIVLIPSLSLSQGPLRQSAHQHHPTSARQPRDAASVVRSESHRPPLTLSYLWIDTYMLIINFISDLILFAYYNLWFDAIGIICEYGCIFNCSQFVIVALTGGSNRIISVAPSHLSSATSRCWNSCTIRIASSSIDTVSYLWFDIANNIWIWCINLFNYAHCVIVTLRRLSSNNLNGTIPSQLGNLAMLQQLYDQNRIVLHWHCVRSLNWHYMIIILSDLTPLW